MKINYQKLHDNLKDLQNKHGVKNHKIDEILNIQKGVYANKLQRLKKGAKGAFLIGEVVTLISFYDCPANAIFKCVIINSDEK